MDPVPKMVIPTRLARRKGELEVSTVEEVRELYALLAKAEAGILGAHAAMAAPEDAPCCDSYSLKGDGCIVTESHWLHKDQHGHKWLSPEGDPGGPEEPKPQPGESWPAACPSCGQADEHADNCERDAQLAAIGAKVGELSEPAWDGDPQCGARHPVSGVGCEAHKPGLHIAPGENEGDPDITWPREPEPRYVTAPVPAPRHVRVVRDGEELPVVPCPHEHPVTGLPCVGTDGHAPPCRPLFGDEWVPPAGGVRFPAGCDPDNALTAVTS